MLEILVLLRGQVRGAWCRGAAYLLLITLWLWSAPLFAKPGSAPRNLILVIGDGMGPQAQELALLFSRYTQRSEFKQSSLEDFLRHSEIGLMQSVPHDALVNDSACASTQIAAGDDALSESLGLDAKGRKVTTVLELARASGKSAGLVSDTRLTHATPAGFVAKQVRRNAENEIAAEMISSGAEVLLSGGLRHFVPRSAEFNSPFSAKSKRDDENDLLAQAKKAGYKLAFDRAGLRAVRSGKILGLFAESGMQDAISEWQKLGQPTGEPSLAEMTDQALQLLSKDPSGFFLMVEAGQIDWAEHNNDAGTLLHEMLRLDRALRVILHFARGRDDTLVVLTADHETGGFGFSYSAADLPEPQSYPGQHGVTYQPQYNFGRSTTLDRLFDQGISFQQLFEAFDRKPEQEHNAKTLTDMVASSTSFKISLNDADAILAREKNKYFRAEHEELSREDWPRIADFSAFYPQYKSRRPALLARALAEQQGVVWASGTHTSTPVVVAAYGPRQWSERFDGFYSTLELGKILKSLVKAN